MTDTILTEKSNPHTSNIDLMDSLEIAKIINSEDKKVASAIQAILPQIAQAIDTVANSFRNGGRLAYFGAGTSGRLGVLDASECPPTFSVPPSLVQGFIAGGEQALRFAVENAEDSTEYAQKDFAQFSPTKNDVIVGISASGNPQYVLTIMSLARQKGIKTIGITSNPDAKLKNYSDIFINPLVGEEVI